MRITVRAGGLFVRNLPEDRDGETAVLDLSEGATPFVVLECLGLPIDGAYLIILNDAVVPRSERAATAMKNNDHLTIMPPIKGGVG